MFMNCLCLSIFWIIAEFTFPCYSRTAYNGAVYQWYLILFFSTSQWFGTTMESQMVQNSRIQIWSHSRITITFAFKTCKLIKFNRHLDHIQGHTSHSTWTFQTFTFNTSKINQVQQASRSHSKSRIIFNKLWKQNAAEFKNSKFNHIQEYRSHSTITLKVNKSQYALRYWLCTPECMLGDMICESTQNGGSAG